MKWLLLISLFHVAFIAGCKDKSKESINHEEFVWQSPTIDLIEQSGRLWDIEQVLLNEEGTVTLVDADSIDGCGRGLMMYDSAKGVVDSLDLKVGQTCTLMDGDHVLITYELLAVDGDSLNFLVTEKFDARSFGDNIKTCTKQVTIKPYQ